jgi:hypothetical protein
LFPALVSHSQTASCESTYGKLLHRLYIFLRCLVGLSVGIVKLVVLEISGSTRTISEVPRFKHDITYELVELRDDPRSCL